MIEESIGCMKAIGWKNQIKYGLRKTHSSASRGLSEKRVPHIT